MPFPSESQHFAEDGAIFVKTFFIALGKVVIKLVLMASNYSTMAKISILLLLQIIPAFPQTPDETLVRSLVERFFALYATEDIQAIMALWSSHSPDRKAFGCLLYTSDAADE